MSLWSRKPDKAPPVLDRNYLSRLARHIGEVEVRELLADGMMELTDRLDRLEELAGADDVQPLVELFHDIAGAAGHLGLTALSVAGVQAGREARSPGCAVADLVAPIMALRAPSLDALGGFCAGEPTESAE